MGLSKEQFEQISSWMYRNARPIDLARWQYHFEEGSSASVVKALEAYQNEDGGFGHALEADCWNPNSSPLQTWWAIQFIKEINLKDKNHLMIRGILKYLDSGDGSSKGRWQFSVPSNNDHPRAPWWSYSEQDEIPGYNPTVALAGFILSYSEKGSKVFEKGEKLAIEALDVFMTRDELTEMHELACFVELYEDLIELSYLELTDMPKLLNKIQQQVDATIEQDSRKWATEYCCKPSHFLRRPDSVVYKGNEQITEDELDFMSNSLSEEGTWAVTWAWGDYEEEFTVSKRWWQANIALQNVRMIRAFERVVR